MEGSFGEGHLNLPESHEQEPQVLSSLTILVSRHGEKYTAEDDIPEGSKPGDLTEKGFETAKEMGRTLQVPDRLTVVSYHTDVPRTEKTAEGIVEGLKQQIAEGNKQAEFRGPKDLTSRLKWNKNSEEILGEINPEFGRITTEKSFDEAINWWIYKSKDSTNNIEWTKGLARTFNTFMGVGEKLKDGSNVLINMVTHGGAPDRFLLSILRQKGLIGKEGAEGLKEMGGALGYLDSFQINVRRFDNGQTNSTFLFRNHEVELTRDDLMELIQNLK
ncbi:hypothetical protein A2V68_03055 [candidate division Kazan bacterium RBG_13_50_9]|uniref:Phosphoglycerate mutase n=1 Tax=candidate division Kazan bacterium RBG_13_50_9 TaxID=1798535 RepID=A0A1F4NSS6_UNCK3|nr:MAG: hypothetical protein A2V68_03055 [candidate division Kazan bacterium RBG_13_50_9]